MKIIYFILFFILFSCSDSADVKVKFENNSTSTASVQTVPSQITPSYLGLKIVSIYLSEDVDENLDNTGLTPMIYLNPQCNGDIETCDVESRDGINHIITDYFNFSKTTEEVNNIINATSESVDAGTYKYIRMEFCKYNTSETKTISLSGQIDGETVTYETVWPNCVKTVAFDSPLNIEGGDEVIVNLQYSLDNLFVYDDMTDGVCDIDKDTQCSTDTIEQTINGTDYCYCWKFPEFEPCVEVNGEQINCNN